MSFPGLTTLEAVRRIAGDEYFDAIELTGFEDSEGREAVKKILEQSHLSVYYGAQPDILSRKLNPNDLDEDRRIEAEKVLMKAVDEAEYFGAEGLSFLSGKWDHQTKDEAYSQLLTTTKNICSYAQTKNIQIELEVFDYDVDKKSLIGPAPLAAKFASDVRMYHKNFGLLIDLSHIPICHETSRDVIRICRPYITHFHFGNAVVTPKAEGYGDKHQRIGYPESANDIPELTDYLEVLKSEGFFNAKNPFVLSMEVTPVKGEDEEIILANTKRCLNRAWALLED